MTEEKIHRINELTALSRLRELTAEEQTERAALRREYIDSVKASLVGHLDNVYFVEADGSQTKLKKKTHEEL